VPLNAGVLRAVACLAAALILSACSGSNGSPQSTAVTSKGDGPGGSAAMTLVAGDYTLAWSASPSSGASCQHRAALETTDELVIHPLMNEPITAAVKDREIRLDDLPAGEYYIDVNSDCSWAFTVRPAS
jgi:hypothetical protein